MKTLKKATKATITGYACTKEEFFDKKDLIVQYTLEGENETLTIGDGKEIQFSVSYNDIKEIVKNALPVTYEARREHFRKEGKVIKEEE